MTTYSIVHSHLESERGREIAGDRQTDRPFGGLRRRGTGYSMGDKVILKDAHTR